MGCKIALFAYDFPHRKSHDFIVELNIKIGKEFCVIAAPRKDLSVDRRKYLNFEIETAPPLSARYLCERLGVPFYALEHENFSGISEIQSELGFKLGLIAGARIIPAKTIEIFPEGIVNFHPGLIPQTSGLDAFYYSIINDVDMGVTAHFIDEKVDAGDLIFFEPLTVSLNEPPEVVSFNNYQLQIIALRKFLADWQGGCIARTPLIRPHKNLPLRPDQKIEVLQRFPKWRYRRYSLMRQRLLFAACKSGDYKGVADVMGSDPELLEALTPEGWTPLIVSAFNGHYEIVEFLLDMGANVNACGLKGTTVFMYAKSQFMHKVDRLPALLALLIRKGADLRRCDMNGLTVFDYLKRAGDMKLLELLYGAESQS